MKPIKESYRKRPPAKGSSHRKGEQKKRNKNRKKAPKAPKPVKPKAVSIKKADSKEIKRHMFVFKSLTKKAKNRDIILRKAPLSLYKTIRLLFKLMKKGAVPLTNAQRHRLKPWVNYIRENSTGKESKVKKNVSQNGDGLSSILKTVLPIIAPILSMIV